MHRIMAMAVAVSSVAFAFSGGQLCGMFFGNVLCDYNEATDVCAQLAFIDWENGEGTMQCPDMDCDEDGNDDDCGPRWTTDHGGTTWSWCDCSASSQSPDVGCTIVLIEDPGHADLGACKYYDCSDEPGCSCYLTPPTRPVGTGIQYCECEIRN